MKKSKRLDCKHITSVSQLRRCGYGIGAVVQLKKPYINPLSGEDIGPPVLSRGRVVGHFGAKPSIEWDRPGKYGKGPQVVDPHIIQVTKPSSKPEILGNAPLSKVKEFTHDIEDSKVTVYRTEPVMDDVGYIVGDVTYELRGKIKDGHVEFTSSRINMNAVPRNQRWMQRQYFESQAIDDLFYPLFEKKRKK
jgi:hypothetical protein